VQQRGGVHELHRGRELDVAVAGVAGEPCQRQREYWPQPLAAGIDQVVGDLRDHRHLRAGARQNDAVDALHVGGNPIEQWIDRGLTGTCERDDDSHLKFSPQRTREHRNAMVDRQVRLPGRAFAGTAAASLLTNGSGRKWPPAR
jgi:hypothetical protein